MLFHDKSLIELTKVVALSAAVVDHGAGHVAQRGRPDVEGLVIDPGQFPFNTFAKFMR